MGIVDKPRHRDQKRESKRIDREIWIRDKSGLWSKQTQVYGDRRRAFEAALAADRKITKDGGNDGIQ